LTLIELTVALSILVVASGLLVLRVSGWTSRQSLHASARAVGNVIRAWRERARVEETTYTMECEGRTYRILSGKEVVRRGSLPPSQSFERPIGIAFGPRGVLPETRIRIVGSSGEEVTLILGAAANEIDYSEGP